jgi:hypothetical protein
MVPTTFLAHAISISVLLYRAFVYGGHDYFLWTAYAAFVFWMAMRARRLKRRVADLVIHAAQTVGLGRVSGEKARPKAAK